MTTTSPPPAPPPTLLDRDAEAEFRTHGYVVVDWLDATATAELAALADEIHPAPPATSPWACDFYADDPAVKVRVGDAIGRAFDEPVRRTFVGHRTFLHAYVVNWPGSGGGIGLHQHSSVVDEPGRRSAVVWCALNTTTPRSGTLHVVPGSHNVPDGPKAERSPDWFRSREDELKAEHAVPVTVGAGQAIVFDNALLHFSDENDGDRPRITAVATVAPRDGGLRYHSWTERGEIEVFELDPEFFVGAVSRDFEWADPEGLRLLEVRPASVPSPTDEELARVLTRPSAVRPRASGGAEPTVHGAG